MKRKLAIVASFCAFAAAVVLLRDLADTSRGPARTDATQPVPQHLPQYVPQREDRAKLGDTPTSDPGQVGDDSVDAADVRTRRPWGELSFAEVRSRAETGDARAQFWLAGMYDDCFLYSLPSRPQVANPYLATLDHIERVEPAARATAHRLKRYANTFCPTVDGGRTIAAGTVEGWLERSAAAGHLPAILRTADKRPEDVLAFAERVRASGDPEAMFWMGEYVSVAGERWPDAATRPMFEAPYAQYAWQLAACRAGYPCGPGSRLMDIVCLTSQQCVPMHYAQFVQRRLTPAQRMELEAAVRMIERRYRPRAPGGG